MEAAARAEEGGDAEGDVDDDEDVQRLVQGMGEEEVREVDAFFGDEEDDGVVMRKVARAGA